MTVITGFVTPNHARRILAANQTDIGNEIDHLRNGGFVGRGLRMQLTPVGFKVTVSQSALAGYYVEPAHLHPTPLQRGVTHFEQYANLQPPAKPAAKQEPLPEPAIQAMTDKPLRYRYRIVRKRYKSLYPREHDTGDGTFISMRCYLPKQGRRLPRLHREVPRKPELPDWIEFQYGDLDELNEVCDHVPVDASVDFRYQPHNGFRTQRRKKSCGTRMKSDETKAHKKALTHRETRRRLKQVIDLALRTGYVDHKVRLPRLTYQNWSM